MGNNKAKKKHKLYSLFENYYKVGLFYKPSMQNNDIFFYIELDETIRLVIKMINDNIIIIHDIIPLTTAYLVKFYDNFINFLSEQKEFTILISKIGNTSCIDDACLKLSVPLVDDNRFLSVPDRLYERMKNIYNNDVSKYGFLLIAVSDNSEFDNSCIQSVNIQENKDTPIVVEIENNITTKQRQIETEQNTNYTVHNSSVLTLFRNYLLKRYRNKAIVLNDIENNTCRISICDIILSISEENDKLIITECDCKDGVFPSSITYLSIFEYIEKFKQCNVIIDNVTNGMVFNVCKVKEYEKIKPIHITKRNTFGTYLIQ